ncbi:hypothetical protein HJFPF1_02236 [Paramyrothecium foliicola]|nr:hypothetical protein HJFPF1_02236 [Paramyrothecium foliicola]
MDVGISMQNTVQQMASPLFRLPLEVRSIIYEHYLTEQQCPSSSFVRGMGDEDFEDKDVPSHNAKTAKPKHDGSLPNWLRPGCTARSRISTELLRTCKLVYGEASVVFHNTTVHKCYHGYGPGSSPSEYFQQFTESQLTQVRRVHLFTQVVDFDQDGLWLRSELQPISQSLQHLTITLRDLGGAPDRPLLLNPFRTGAADRRTMSQFMEADLRKGTNRKMPKAGWGGSFCHFPALKSLTIELEDQATSYAELENLVAWAQTWSFPLGEGRAMVTKGAPSSRTWRRPQNHHHDQEHCYEPPQIITKSILWEEAPQEKGPQQTAQKRKSKKPNASKVSPRRPIARTRSQARNNRIERPAYNPCLGGLNSIFAHASDESLRELIDWGVL